MKLESLSIRDFRCIESLDLSFKDDLDLIRDCVPIVGPNTSGKTTILDAIALSLMAVNESYKLRQGLRLSAPALVRSGAIRAQVSSTFWFSDDEIEAITEVLGRLDKPFQNPEPWKNHVTIHWTFPDPEGQNPNGSFDDEPSGGFLLFLGRKLLEKYLHAPGLGPRHFKRIGSMFMFDQRRTGLSKPLSFQEIRQLGQFLDPERFGMDNGNTSTETGTIQQSEQAGYGIASDPRLILTNRVQSRRRQGLCGL